MSSASDDVILKGVWWGERREEKRSRAVDFTWLLFLIIKKLQKVLMGWDGKKSRFWECISLGIFLIRSILRETSPRTPQIMNADLPGAVLMQSPG